MLNKLGTALRSSCMVTRGDSVTCAVSGGADSISLLFGLWLLKDRMGFTLGAAHFNHHLRGAESDADEAFVRDFCSHYQIPLICGGGQVVAGAKGLEAAAREARYAFLRTIPGKIATAHTADDNAETVLMHLLRGTGLRGLGGIAPINGQLIRPMLSVTRAEVMQFLEDYSLPHREDSSNAGDDFLRNRIRHKVMPLLKAENPAFSESVSAMAGRLRQDEQFLEQQLPVSLPPVSVLRQMAPALRSRCLDSFLKASSVPEPEQSHISLAESLVLSDCPSAAADFPGGIRIMRCYDQLCAVPVTSAPAAVSVSFPGTVELPQWGVRISGTPEDNGGVRMSVSGECVVRSRSAGDTIRLHGGTRTLKKWMIDQKIPEVRRSSVPVLADEKGVLAVLGAGPNLERISSEGVYIRMDPITTEADI